MQMVFDDLGSLRQGMVDRVDRILQPAAQHICRRQQTPRDFVLGIGGYGGTGDLRGMIVPLRAQQHFARIVRIPAIFGSERHGAQRRLDRLHRPTDSEHGGQTGDAAPLHWRSSIRAAPGKMLKGVLVPASSSENTAGMEGDFKRSRYGFARPLGVKNGLIELPTAAKEPLA